MQLQLQFTQFPSLYGGEMKPLWWQKFNFNPLLTEKQPGAQAICKEWHMQHVLNCWARAELEPRAGTGDRSLQVKQ